MKRIAAGQFKQICLRLMDEVRETGQPVVITKRGTPVAQLAPLPADETRGWAGALRDSGRITGDLVAPAVGEDEWEVLRG